VRFLLFGLVALLILLAASYLLVKADPKVLARRAKPVGIGLAIALAIVLTLTGRFGLARRLLAGAFAFLGPSSPFGTGSGPAGGSTRRPGTSRVRTALFDAVARYHRPLTLILQATAQAAEHRREAEAAGVQVQFEAFADRCYADDGTLLNRSTAGAVHTRERMLEQVAQLMREQCVTTQSGKRIPLQAQTLCVHGDNLEAVQAIAAIRALVNGD